MSDELWLEDAPQFVEGEYWCPEIQNDYFDGDDWDFVTPHMIWLKKQQDELIFEEWEVKQQELYVGGLGNNTVSKSPLFDMILKAADLVLKSQIENVILDTLKKQI